MYPSPHAIFASFKLKPDVKIGRDDLRQLLIEVRQHIHTTQDLRKKHSLVVLGVSFSLWSSISEKLPKAMRSSRETERSAVLESGGVFHDSNADSYLVALMAQISSLKLMLSVMISKLLSFIPIIKNMGRVHLLFAILRSLIMVN